jgi:cytochrome b561
MSVERKEISMSAKSTSTRYGSIAIAIHWLTALLIVMLFTTGLLAAGTTDEAAKLALLRAHIPLGAGALLLTVLRIVWWLVADRRPDLPTEQPAWQKFMAKAVHIALYLVVLESAGSGIATIILSDALPAIIGTGALPDFNTVLPRAVHGIGSRVMLALLAMHVGAALYHQFIRRDHLLARMGVGTA